MWVACQKEDENFVHRKGRLLKNMFGVYYFWGGNALVHMAYKRNTTPFSSTEPLNPSLVDTKDGL